MLKIQFIIMKLPRSFFIRPTSIVAQDLLGQRLVWGNHQGIITETEAYTMDDPACHAFRGLTPRTAVMFGPAGVSYVYFIYGMYHCLNIVTEPEGIAAAVLIRGVVIPGQHLNGPGKVCRHFGIDRTHNGLDLTENPEYYVESTGFQPCYQTTSRIGITKGVDRLWRFVVESGSLPKEM